MRALRVMARIWLLAAVLTSVLTSSAVAAEFHKFGIESVEAELSTHEAGAHPDFTTKLVVKTDPSAPELNGDHLPYARLKDVVVDIPPGLVGNLNAVDQCANAQFVTAKTGGQGCPFSAQVGISESRLFSGSPGLLAKSPIFNLEPAGENQVARFGFLVQAVPVFINVHVRSDSDYGVTAKVTNLSAIAFMVHTRTTFWGVPADSSHDTLRFTGQEVLESKQESPPRSAEHPLEQFLTNPTSCGGQLEVRFAVASYQEPDRFDHASAPLGEITGCGGLEFAPSLSLAASSREAAAPSGAEASLNIPQNEAWDERATSHLRNAVIRLPEGVSVSPGAADGLEACSEEQVGYRVSPPPPANCPLASKIAAAEIDSPSLTEPIEGAIYQRTPAPGHLFRVWLVADDLGVHVKIPGEFQLAPRTGQITSLFLDTPQLPLRGLELRFKDGPRGVLATPRRCGTYESAYSLTPWSGQGDAQGAIPMSFDQNCATGGFSPGLRAGSTTSLGGAFTNLLTTISQSSGEDNLSGLEVTMPPGVLARLKGVGVCPEPSAAAADCPASSLVGHTTVATGFGTNPLWIPQPGRAPTAVYLAGPYRSAPYSLLVRTPAQAGPFDLGDVVVRVALRIDPETTQVTATSDPLPQILQGVPLPYREVRVFLDRSRFAINPTSCEPMAVTGTATSAQGTAAPLSTRFQVGACARLKFEPTLSLRLRGETERGGNPALRATLRMPRRGANLERTAVTLPRSAFLDQAHLRTICTRTRFAAESCPKESIYGRAKAWSPLLAEPLAGPVYLRSSDNQLPDLVAVLRGPASQPVEVHVAGRIDSVKGAIRASFEQLPDAPVSRFVLSMRGGPKGLVQNSTDLCARPRRATVKTDAHNGKIRDFRAEVGVGCGGRDGPTSRRPTPD